MNRALALVAIPLVLGSVLTTTACNRRVFKQVEISCDKTIDKPLNIPAEKAADILVVVDNSGSMFEEQQNLAANFLNADATACPIPVESLGDFAHCDDDAPPAVCQFANPTEDQLAGDLRNCGFIQVLAAYENNFRVGVITTDVGLCDNRIPDSQAAQCDLSDGRCVLDASASCDGTAGSCANTWSFRPQRGCLQPSGPPGTREKFIQRSDSDSDDSNVRNIGARFKATLDNIQTFGSPYERGLDAMEDFLDPNTARSPGCEDDLKNFLRKDAKLVVIFLTDEEDCSHRPDSEFPDELAGEVCGEFRGLVTNPLNPSLCYSQKDKLTAVQHYADFLASIKDDRNDVSVAVIAGGLKQGDDIVAGGCFPPDGDGDPLGGCEETKGSSNSGDCASRPSSVEQCCRADPGGRYFELADALGGLKDSICVNSFRRTMIKIASFIGAVDFVDLDEAPADINLMFVEVTKAGSTESSVVPRITGSECGDGNGWVYQEPDATTHRVRFCGTARPGPGDDVSVRAKASRDSADPSSDNPCELASGG